MADHIFLITFVALAEGDLRKPFRLIEEGSYGEVKNVQRRGEAYTIRLATNDSLEDLRQLLQSRGVFLLEIAEEDDGQYKWRSKKYKEYFPPKSR